MNNLSKIADAQTPAPPTSTPGLLAVIIERIRAGATLEETKEYYRFAREIQADEARAEYTRAMTLAQQEMSAVSRDMANAQTRSRYASLAAIDNAIRPIYSKHGLAPSFDETESPKGENWIRVICRLSHASGHVEQFHADMPADGVGAKGAAIMTRTHAAMSADTYGRRLLLKRIFNLAEQDDDGNAAGNGNGKIAEDQVEQLKNMLTEGCDSEWLKRFFDYASKTLHAEVKGFADIPAGKFEWAQLAIRTHRK